MLGCIMAVGLMFTNINEISAHPLFYDSNNNPIEFIWTNISNGKALLNVGYYNLPIEGVNNLPTVVAAWPSKTSLVSVTQTSTSVSNVDYMTVSAERWSEITNDEFLDPSMFTVFSTNAGEAVQNTTDAMAASSKTISYAIIYVMPGYEKLWGDYVWEYDMAH